MTTTALLTGKNILLTLGRPLRRSEAFRDGVFVCVCVFEMSLNYVPHHQLALPHESSAAWA